MATTPLPAASTDTILIGASPGPAPDGSTYSRRGEGIATTTYFVCVGSTNPPGPARTIDRVDDEALAVEMVRVVEETHPTAWATVRPVTPLRGPATSSYLAVVQEDQQDYDDRNDEVLSLAAETRAEALRRLGRSDDDDAPSAVDRDATSSDGGTVEAMAEFEPRRKSGQRVRAVLGRRQAYPATVEQAQQDHDDRLDEPQAQAPENRAEALRRLGRSDEDDAPRAVDDDPADAPPTVDRDDTNVDTTDGEPVAATTTYEGRAETMAEVEPHRKPGRRARARLARRGSEHLQDGLTVERVGTASSEDLQPSEDAAEVNERIAQYTLAPERRSGRDRRSDIDRRQAQVEGFDPSSERRGGGVDRRWGISRRRATERAAAPVRNS